MSPWDELVVLVESLGMRAHPTGSAYIIGSKYKDIDVVALCSCDGFQCPSMIYSKGYRLDNEVYDEPTPNGFDSWRQQNQNLIVVHEEAFFDRWITASNVARRLKLASRDDRVMLFAAILYATNPGREND